MKSKKIVRRSLLGLFVVLFLTMCVASFFPRHGRAGTPDEVGRRGLPGNARNLTWYSPGAFGPNSTLSFDTDEMSFHAWVQEDGQGIDLEGPLDTEQGTYVSTFDPETEQIISVFIEKATVYGWLEGDRSWRYVFDQKNGRAYRHIASR